MSEQTSPFGRWLSRLDVTDKIVHGLLVAVIISGGVAALAANPSDASSYDPGYGTANGSAGYSNPDGGSSSDGSTNTSGESSGSATGESKDCLGSDPVPVDDACPTPQGEAGLEAVFADLPSGCKSSMSLLGSKAAAAYQAYRQCVQPELVGSGEPTMTYVVFNDYDTAVRYFDDKFDSGASRYNSYLVEYPLTHFPDGHWEVARMYDSGTGYPFSASASCARPEVCPEALDAVTFMDPSNFTP